jgi:Xaa-Pro aminopeptidase
VLAAQQAAIRAVRPGVHMHQVDAAARRVVERAGFGDAFMHGIGHQLGIDVHDATPDGPLKAGMVVTIEPGVYLPDRKLGVRIEDDILVTPRGPRNLTSMIPKKPDQIEAMMRRSRGRR